MRGLSFLACRSLLCGEIAMFQGLRSNSETVSRLTYVYGLTQEQEKSP